MNGPLVEGYDLKLVMPECHRNADWFRATAYLPSDISEALPYINAEFGTSDYDHDAKTLLWTSNKKKYAFRPREIDIAPVESREEAERLLGSVVETINNIWRRKEEIKPNFEGKKPLPNVLDIFKLLARTNCKECGFPTCMAFATALRKDSTKLPLCPYLSPKAYADLG